MENIKKKKNLTSISAEILLNLLKMLKKSIKKNLNDVKNFSNVLKFIRKIKLMKIFESLKMR